MSILLIVLYALSSSTFLKYVQRGYSNSSGKQKIFN